MSPYPERSLLWRSSAVALTVAYGAPALAEAPANPKDPNGVAACFAEQLSNPFFLDIFVPESDRQLPKGREISVFQKAFVTGNLIFQNVKFIIPVDGQRLIYAKATSRIPLDRTTPISEEVITLQVTFSPELKFDLEKHRDDILLEPTAADKAESMKALDAGIQCIEKKDGKSVLPQPPAAKPAGVVRGWLKEL